MNMNEQLLKKEKNLDDLKLETSLINAYEILKKWLDKKPNNKELNILNDALIQIGIIIAVKQNEIGNLKAINKELKLKLLNHAKNS